MFPGNTGLVYACNSDPIEFGKRMNKDTGEILWTNDYPIPVGPDGGYVVVGNTYYHWTGYINTDKTLIAIDTETGGTKYVSKALPGDGDQENDLVAGPDGTIYTTRDGGALYAFKDDGTGFSEKWSRSPGPLVKAAGWDGTLYAASAVDNNLIRLDPNSGATLDSVQTPVNVLSGYISVGADSTIYVATGELNGRYIALSPDLQILKWEIAVPYSYYSGPALAKDGVLVTVGAGTAITAYKTGQPLKPVADLHVDERRIVAGDVAHFHDQSSFTPDSWAWSFPGSSTLTSTDQNPEITYSAPGVYDVSLVASNSLGSDSISKSCYIEVVPSTGVAEHSADVPDVVRLFQNYPNPFNPTTHFGFEISDFGFVSLKIYDLLGREVATLVNGMKAPGTYTVKWDASGFSSGVYVYRLRAGSTVASRKLIVQK